MPDALLGLLLDFDSMAGVYIYIRVLHECVIIVYAVSNYEIQTHFSNSIKGILKSYKIFLYFFHSSIPYVKNYV